MNFLDKFKGKTHMIKRQDVGGILGKRNSRFNDGSNKKGNLTSFSVPNTLNNKNNKNEIKGKNPSQSQQDLQRMKKINPFVMANPFYLDEQERQRDEKIKKQNEIRQRRERERRKKELIEAKMLEQSKFNKEKFNSKEWVPMGGLGPNIGGQQWSQKKQMQSKMLKFAEEIRQINISRLKKLPFMSYSHMNKQGLKDPRTKAIQYSLTIPKPKLVYGQKTHQQVNHNISTQYRQLSELEQLEQNHKKLSKLIQRF